MRLEDELKMQQFTDNFQRAYLNIIFTASWMETSMQQRLKHYNITTPQFNVLRILRGQKGKPMSAFAIQERMIHRTSNVTRILEKLVEKNLVTRESSPVNRRMIDVRLTSEGLDLVNSTDTMAIDAYKQMACAMNEEEARLMGDWLDKIREQEPGCGCDKD
ncbi:MarR family winged helix-turn-helix transcriptional regulator [Taibaiella koreensis]|uniref:MarR family winged helix-turn-helix transcriptional regulator n=1 Tax=Taibaiella koreensis TaxID=1268548 RepID=UPI000E5A0886|nr:MarR family transcriptional regulator [Taibaiella koreensis]